MDHVAAQRRLDRMSHKPSTAGLSPTPNKLVRVAVWRARGMHAGQVVRLRAAPGNHRWRVRAEWTRPTADGQLEHVEQTFDAAEPIPIRAMHDTVLREISADLPDGTLVNDASLEFFIRPRAKKGR